MKKILALLIFAVIGILIALNYSPAKKIVEQRKETVSAQTTAKIIATPDQIKINSIGVEALIESVTTDSLGRMDIPKDFRNTAWYSLGAKPGEKGSAVIDGHVDTPQGEASVFSRINELKVGDEIEVIDKIGATHTFIVERTKSYDLSQMPLGDIFTQDTNEKRLNLITCSGVWDKANKMYSSRFVVYAKMRS